MRYIEKNITHQPFSLKEYKETTPNASYSGFGDTDQLLKKALIMEQGGLCAYCLKRISLKRNERLKKPSIEVEHYCSQDEHPELDLEYSNMLGVCNGNSFGEEHCDKSKKEVLLKELNPLDNTIESKLTYRKDGIIKASQVNLEIEEDILLLNINNQTLKENRAEVLDFARERMSRKYPPPKQWTKTQIQMEIDEWKSRNSKGLFRPFCQIAIWFWEEEKKKKRYPEK